MAESPPPGPGENRLARETSPYLLQHSANPVDWYPWGPEALARARREDRPILLSVGYAACHWCHVMAHESFEDPGIAELMNARFVNVKVDREERPDLDTIYQQALALLGEHGGWPLTMFLTSEGHPFWGGTYFPKQPMYGRPGFAKVLTAISEVYRNEPDKVRQNVAGLTQGLQDLARPQAGDGVGLEVLDSAARRLAPQIDSTHGGLGGPPKFPQPSILALLWRAALRTGDAEARRGVETTLANMSQGGLYDHLGGGFARYSVDARWLVPHFEKMLYDNAQILDLLTWAWQTTGRALYRDRVHETVAWLHREMIARDADGRETGAFAATLDADSEGEEGRLYVWTEAEIDALLGADSDLFKRIYDVGPEGNWEGKTILNRLHAMEPLDDESEARLAACRATLLRARTMRVRPGWDDKVLADWNGLMIHALAEAAAAFGEPDWLASAERAFAFVAGTMQDGGRLRHVWRHGQLKHPATLDDHASLIRAALTLFEHTGRTAYLDRAVAWTGLLDAHYWDGEAGGYFATADDVADIIVRTRGAQDNAQPSGNGLMVQSLVRLHYLTGERAYHDRAAATIAAFSGELQRNFVPLCALLNGVELLHRGLQIVVVGPPRAAETAALLAPVHARCLPNRILRHIGPEDALPPGHPAAGKGQREGRATAYVCRGPTCSLPITEAAALARELETA